MPNSFNRTKLVEREAFDPLNPVHIESLEVFIRTGNWGSVQFYTELPYTDVPMTVLMKFAQHHLGVVRESAEERSERLSKMNLVQIVPTETREQNRARLEAANVLILEALKKRGTTPNWTS
jgi:hypothetical protein